MIKIIHRGPERTSETSKEASELLHVIASSLSLKGEFELTYSKAGTGSVLCLTTFAPVAKEEDVLVDSDNKAAIDVDPAESAIKQKRKPRNAASSEPTAP